MQMMSITTSRCSFTRSSAGQVTSGSLSVPTGISRRTLTGKFPRWTRCAWHCTSGCTRVGVSYGKRPLSLKTEIGWRNRSGGPRCIVSGAFCSAFAINYGGCCSRDQVSAPSSRVVWVERYCFCAASACLIIDHAECKSHEGESKHVSRFYKIVGEIVRSQAVVVGQSSRLAWDGKGRN